MRFPKFFVLLFFMIGAFFACNSIAQQPANLSVNAFQKGINQKNIQVLDVRTPGEYQTGHLKNALLADWMNQEEFAKKVSSLDKSKTVYTYCQVGGRSSKAATLLKEKGYTVYNLEGGIAAWKQAGKPVEGGGKSNK